MPALCLRHLQCILAHLLLDRRSNSEREHRAVELRAVPVAALGQLVGAAGVAAHHALDAALQLVAQYRLDPQQVESVRVSVAPAAFQSLPYSGPKNPWEARASLQYVVATALLYGPPLLDQFTDTAVSDNRVREMMGRITVDASETPTPLIPNPSTVAVTLTGGRVLHHRVEFARGHRALPLDAEELDAKFLYCSRYILPPDHIEGAIHQFRDLENIADVTGLASILGG